MLSKKNIIEITLVLWIVLALCYFIRTPHWIRSHDEWTHIQYTEYVAKKHCLPVQGEIFQAVQPPLYYVLNSFVPFASFDSGSKESLKHINYVRLISIFYGVVTLVLLFWFLNEVTTDKFLQAITILFIATTPKFVFVFSTYNNDSLANLLCIAIIVISYKLYNKWSWGLAPILLLLATASIYTKYSSLLCIGSLLIFFRVSLVKNIKPRLSNLLFIILFLSCLFILPLAIFHNYKHTHKLFPPAFPSPTMFFDHGIYDKYKNILGMVLKLPKLQIRLPDYSHEWDEPFTYPEWTSNIHPSTKQFDYFAYQFVTSIIGEYKYLTPNVKIIWGLFLIHLFTYLIVFKDVFKTAITRFCAFVIFCTFLLELIFLMPTFISFPNPSPDYRYISWLWACWAGLYAGLFENTKSRPWSLLLTSIFAIGIIINIYVLSTVTTTF